LRGSPSKYVSCATSKYLDSNVVGIKTESYKQLLNHSECHYFCKARHLSLFFFSFCIHNFSRVQVCHYPALCANKRSWVIEVEILGHVFKEILVTSVGLRQKEIRRKMWILIHYSLLIRIKPRVLTQGSLNA